MHLTENILSLIESYIQNTDYDSAKKLIHSLLKTNKKNIQLMYLEAVLNRLTNKKSLAKFQLLNLEKYGIYQINEQLGMLYYDEKDYLNTEKQCSLAIKNGSRNPDLYLILAICFAEQKKYKEALEILKIEIIYRNKKYDCLFNIGLIKEKLNLDEEAIKYFEKCIEIDPQKKEAYINIGYTLTKIKSYQKAIDFLKLAIKNDKENKHLIDNNILEGQCFHIERIIGNWKNYPFITEQLKKEKLKEESFRFHPHDIMLWDVSHELFLENLKLYNEKKYSISDQLNKKIIKYNHHPKIRLGYFSSDLREHAVGYSVVELIELHDRTQFEVHAFSFDAGHIGDQMRPRLMNAFDHWHDVQNLSDLDVVKLARSLEIDIAINLNGHTQGARNDIFAYRAAPVQINYLGYPGTMGADYMDYILADRIVIPEENQRFYSEKVLYLPDCYHANDTKRPIANETPSREECGLPENGFVFACFNASYKITPEVFDSWMRILSAVEGSILWLSDTNQAFKENIFKKINSNNLNKKIVFSKRENLIEKHIARQRLADLFLDTNPYNAHTTASDALLVGLPLLTRIGNTFPSRVSASLLTAIGLEELITSTSEEYEQKAIELGNDPEKIKKLKEKLLRNKSTYPLFDTARFTKNLENQYVNILR